MTNKNIFIGLAVLVVLGAGFFVITSRTGTPTPEPQTQVENIVATTTATTTEAEVDVEVEALETNNTDNDSPIKFTESRLSVIEIGPREAALTPENAFRFMIEALRARDFERVLSHMHPSVRGQYKTAFENYYTEQDHPIMVRYYNGVVGEPVLSQPQHNIYEIKIGRKDGSSSPYISYVIYDDSLGEYFVTEL